MAFIIAVLLAFTTLNAPKLSDSLSNKELAALKNDLKFQREVFTPDVINVNELLSNLNNPTKDLNTEVLNNDIGAALSESKSQINEIESIDTLLYRNVILALSDLQIAINRKIELEESLKGTGNIQTELQQYKTENRQLKADIKALESGGGEDCLEYKNALKKAEEQLTLKKMEIRALESQVEQLRNK